MELNIYLNISNNSISMQGESGGWREEKKKWKKGRRRLKEREERGWTKDKI